MAGIRHPHAAAGQDRHLPAHLVTCMLVTGRRMIEMLALDLALAGWQKPDTTPTPSLCLKILLLLSSTPASL